MEKVKHCYYITLYYHIINVFLTHDLYSASISLSLCFYHAPKIQAHSCVEKASVICMVKFRQLEVDENYSLHGDVLQIALEVISCSVI